MADAPPPRFGLNGKVALVTGATLPIDAGDTAT